MGKNQNFLGVLLFFIFLVTTVTDAQTYKPKLPPEANSEPLYQQLRNAKLSGDSIAVKNLVFRKDVAVFTFKEGRKYLEYNIDLRLLTALLWNGEKAGQELFYAFLKGKSYGELVFMADPLGAQEVDGEKILLAAPGITIYKSPSEKEPLLLICSVCSCGTPKPAINSFSPC
jgi:hypothetical protein